MSREDLAWVVGQGGSVELLIGDIQAGLAARPYELAQVGGGWMLRTLTLCRVVLPTRPLR